jgi:hypothetical protein
MKSVAKHPWSEEMAWLEHDEQESYRDYKISKVRFPSDNLTNEEIAALTIDCDPHK